MLKFPGRSSASAMVFAAAAMRIFYGMGTEHYAAYNAVWLCPIAGLVLFVPFGMAICRTGNMQNGSVWQYFCDRCPKAIMKLAAIVFSLMLIYDCALTARLTAATANFAALNNISILWLMLPLTAVIFVVVMLGPDAEGYSARIWLKLLPIFLASVAAVQFKKYNSSWLMPILGGGLPAIAQGGLLSGGWMAMLSLIWLVAVPDRKQNRPLRSGIYAAAAACVLLAALQMLCPAMVETNLSQMARVEIILSNNRVSHTLQMFLIMLWFVGMLHLISAEAAAAACFIQSLSLKLPKWTIALICSAAVSALAISDLVRDGISRKVYPLSFPAIGLVFALLMGISFVKGGGRKHAQA